MLNADHTQPTLTARRLSRAARSSAAAIAAYPDAAAATVKQSPPPRGAGLVA